MFDKKKGELVVELLVISGYYGWIKSLGYYFVLYISISFNLILIKILSIDLN